MLLREKELEKSKKSLFGRSQRVMHPEDTPLYLRDLFSLLLLHLLQQWGYTDAENKILSAGNPGVSKGLS